MPVLVDFVMFPIDWTQSKSVFVARKLDIIDKSGLPYQFTSMGTSMKGNSADDVFTVIMKPIRNFRWITSGSAVRSK